MMLSAYMSEMKLGSFFIPIYHSHQQTIYWKLVTTTVVDEPQLNPVGNISYRNVGRYVKKGG
jgi:hypothetical protein